MTMRNCDGWVRAALAAALAVAAAGTLPVRAQPFVTAITLDGTLPTPTTVTPAGNVYNINGGTIAGNNQFHSFGLFSVGTGDVASFGGPSGIQNIVSRVTGGASAINGTLQSTIAGANLFLLNPAGILFGPNAALDVQGSFHATTADYIRLGNDGIFFADPARASVLTASAPSAFGFLTTDPKPIEVQTGGVDFSIFFPAAQLMVPQGQTLSLVGGNAPGSDVPGVSIGALDGSTPGYVVAPGGRVNLVSVAGPGEATFDGVGFNVDGFSSLGSIKVGPGSLVDAKEIFIRGGKLAINDGVLLPGAFALELSFVGFSPLPDGGEVNIKVTDDVTITGSPFANEPLTFAPPGIFVYNGDPLGNFVAAPAKLPDVKIEARSVSISGYAGIQMQRNAPGAAGHVNIKADTVTVGSGGSIVLINAHEGEGPSLTIDARQVEVSGDGSTSPLNFEGLAAQGLRNPAYPFTIDAPLLTANSGSITINATESLSVTGLGQITTDSRNFGRAGDITITAGNVTVAGTGDAQSALIGSQSNFAGDSGNIGINATGSITVKDGGRITSASLGSGNAGNISLTAGGPITLSGQDARIVGATFQPPDDQLNELFNSVFFRSFDEFRADMTNPSATLMEVLAYLRDIAGLVPIPGLDLTPGDAGAVSVATPQLTLNAGTRIETSTGWEGNAGSVIGNVGTLSVLDSGAIRSRSGVELLDGSMGVGPGAAGSVMFTASDTITVSGAGSVVSTSTFGDGKGGDVELNAGNRVSIVDGGAVRADSGGPLGGSVVSGAGLAGDIKITAGNEILLNSGQITTQTLTANGGNITLLAPNLVQLQDSVISTSVQGGEGIGGNILIDPQFVIVNNSSIIANAFGGPGGNITIIANNFLSSANSVIQASSALSTPGVINIFSPENNVENSISQLPAAFIDASALLRGLCTARRTGAASSFVVAGRGGVPVDADGYLPSFGTDAAAAVADAADPGQVAAGRTSEPPLAVALLLANDLDCAR